MVSPSLAVSVTPDGVVGFDPTTGSEAWSDVSRARGPLTQPAVDSASGAGGLIVFTEGNAPANSAVVALGVSDRQREWTTRVDDLVRAAPALADGTVYVGTRAGSLYAIDAATGAVRWHDRLGAGVEVTPAVGGGLVYAISERTTDGTTILHAVHADTGRTAWTYGPRGVTIGVTSPTLAGARLLVGFGDASVRAFDAAKGGSPLWAQPVRGFFTATSTVAVADGAAFALDETGGVYRFDVATGHRVWDYQFPSAVTWAAPLAAGGTLYVGTNDGTLAALAASTGHLLWQAHLFHGPVGGVVPAGDTLLVPVVAGDGGVVAFRHDPNGGVTDLHSPTELDLPVALANFGGAVLLILFVLLGLFRGVLRPRRGSGPPAPIPVVQHGSDEEAGAG
jgi:outer membrane protein assembly factor BamB